MSHQLDINHKSCGQMSSQGLKNRSTYTQLLEVMPCLQQRIEDYVKQLETWHPQQSLVLEEQRHGQATKEQEIILICLMCQVANLLQSGATGGMGLQLLCPSLGSCGDVGGGQQTQSPRQPDQRGHQLSDLEATAISCNLSNRGREIFTSYTSSFRDYNNYQNDKYHEDRNTSVRMRWGAHSQSLGFTESCAKYCALSLALPGPQSRCYYLLIDKRMGTE